MPRKQPFHAFSVYINYSDGRAVMPYLESSERKAAWAFYQAVLTVAASPDRAAKVTLKRDGELLQVMVLH